MVALAYSFYLSFKHKGNSKTLVQPLSLEHYVHDHPLEVVQVLQNPCLASLSFYFAFFQKARKLRKAMQSCQDWIELQIQVQNIFKPDQTQDLWILRQPGFGQPNSYSQLEPQCVVYVISNPTAKHHFSVNFTPKLFLTQH